MEAKKRFISEALTILNLPIVHTVNKNGGYGPDKEIIYITHPFGSPAMQTDKKGEATATYLSNGSIDFRIKTPGFPEIVVLNGHFDKMDKRETNVPAQNVWLELGGEIASLMNPALELTLRTQKIKVVKINKPIPAMWYCGVFETTTGTTLESAVKVWLCGNKHGPLLMREIFINNSNSISVTGKLWTYFNLPATMERTWDRDIWYNQGLPLSGKESVIASAVPHREIMQIKRVISDYSEQIKFTCATCDYLTFIGHTGSTAFLPLAVKQGKFLMHGAGARLNRFATSTISANGFDFSIPPNSFAVLRQGVLYITNETLIKEFKSILSVMSGGFNELEKAFRKAANHLIEQTGIDLLVNIQPTIENKKNNIQSEFQIKVPENPVLEAFFSSTWENAKGMYERSYGRRIGDGVEIGMRDRAQDMWSKMKEDPMLVRNDLLHMFSMMYTQENLPSKLPSPLPLSIKLYGTFPRQYPSKWIDRTKAVDCDTRPYGDSAIWPVETLLKYLRETGDYTILTEKVPSVMLTDTEDPVKSKIVGTTDLHTVLQIIQIIFESYGRHLEDSPYGMAQVMYGDWADPIDMMGSSRPGDPTTRGKGRGTSIRLSAHLFLVLVQYIDFLLDERIDKLFGEAIESEVTVKELISLANQLRKNILYYAWEECDDTNTSGFISFIHEFNLDGSVPDYQKGEIGYTIGSMKGKDFDGVCRRELLSNAYGLEMVAMERDYLEPIADREKKIAQIFQMVDHLLSDERLGVKLLSEPIANNENSLKYCGRMGIVPVGTSENGEYHHAGSMMQYFRLAYSEQIDLAWKYYKPLLSIYHDEYINGPFDMFTNSYVADANDPHFGAGMLFGSSGSLDWTIEIIERIAGLNLNLFSSNQPDLVVSPRLPDEFGDGVEFRRIVHCFSKKRFKKIPVHIKIEKAKTPAQKGIWINGTRKNKAEINDLAGYEQIEVIYKNI